jgi:hypothetical protein
MPAAVSCAFFSGPAAACSSPHRLRQPRETGRRQGVEQGVGIPEVMRRRGVADARPLGRAAQRKGIDALFDQFGLGGIQQRRAQIAMVIRLVLVLPRRRHVLFPPPANHEARLS